MAVLNSLVLLYFRTKRKNLAKGKSLARSIQDVFCWRYSDSRPVGGVGGVGGEGSRPPECRWGIVWVTPPRLPYVRGTEPLIILSCTMGGRARRKPQQSIFSGC